ncbi:zinc finger protein 830 isoform X2 [Rhinatrema bivittatum]|uniref:zinc finger protein 830 isoform X2 n=1 Tax=Rhinatrema bivittatum TaxID=194408 RepID=UPI00112E9E65|nr:zinc finger protein 830 isoform X2 [Rhinatrema bivittatum]
MASDAKKQEVLRRLMRDERRRNASIRKRVESPYAKYSSLGHLSCALCNTSIKNELLWTTHTLGKQHKEKVAELKGGKQEAPGPSISTSSFHPLGRKVLDTGSQEIKKRKAVSGERPLTPVSGLPADFFEKAGEASQKALPSKGPGLLAGDYDEEEEGEEEDGMSSNPTVSSVVQKATDIPSPAQITDNSLPPDFFDSKTPPAPLVTHSGSILKADIQEKTVERKENTAEALPEGFFDDPEVDAKVRKVDAPKDQMDKEWDEFQKEMRQVNTVSEAIVAEEDEEGRLDRQIEEIDEQIECYRRVEALRDRQDMLKGTFLEAMKSRAFRKQDDEDTDSDDGELQILLCQDWRVKGALL